MNSSIYDIPILNLLFILAPVLVVAFVYARWSMQVGTILYATVRMVSQLLLIGLVLTYIFAKRHPAIIVSLLSFMLLVASWISLRPIKAERKSLYPRAFIGLSVGGLISLGLVIFGVIGLKPWYEPRYLIPLAGMIFANGMNGVSLAAERLHAEMKRGEPWERARGVAYRTSLIPLINSFFAVGLVALPGMMTGQILSGVSPLIAVRYQIMVMCMVLSSAGISSAIYLGLLKRTLNL